MSSGINSSSKSDLSFDFWPLLFLCFLLQPCSTLAQTTEVTTLRAEQEDKIREVVLRSQMLEWIKDEVKTVKRTESTSDENGSEQTDFETFYISVDDKDPTEDFLNRFKDLPRRVRKESDPVVGKRTPPGVPIRKLVFYVEKLSWLKSDIIEMEGGYHCGLLCAANITFRLKLVKGRWVIKMQRTNWVS